MSANDWAAMSIAIITTVTGFTAAIRWLVRQFLKELKPNGGYSIKDQVNRLELRVDAIYEMLLDRK